jgi:hypothetical protein
MKQDPGKHGPEQLNDGVRDIPVWTRRCAQNRTLAFVGFLPIWLVGCGVLLVLGTGYDRAQAAGARLLAGGCLVLLCAAVTVMLWFRFVSGGRITRRIADRLYGSEGSASMAWPESLKRRIPLFAYFLFAFCAVTAIGLVLGGIFPVEYWVSVSAVFFVPFLVYAFMKLGDVASPFMLLWPALYAAHAIVSLSGLLLIGTPFSLAPKYQALDLLIPVLGYGILAGLAGHIYSRIALRRLRALAASAESAGEGEEAAR